MRRDKVHLLILAVAIAGVVLMKGHSHQPRSRAVVDDGAAETDLPVTGKAAQVIQSATSQLTAMPKVSVVPTSKPAIVPSVPNPFSHELQVYAILHSKVFLSPSEQADKADLLRDRRVLRGLGTVLNRPPTDLKASIDQNLALDLLLEALRTGDSDVAAEVLRDIVSDSQVENPKLEPTVRENLAGIKAEVLFKWSAFRPAQAGDLASWLPGPVSQRIWQNVLEAQSSNLAESAGLKNK
jgi:hypothetical protein